MHGHQPQIPEWSTLVISAMFVALLLFFVGMPIPIGYDRGKVAWVQWCGTGMHPHEVYLTDHGFQTLHPKDRTKGET